MEYLLYFAPQHLTKSKRVNANKVQKMSKTVNNSFFKEILLQHIQQQHSGAIILNH